MRIVFTCGGTGGHINPAIALADLVKQKDPSTEILFIGADGMERNLVPRAGYSIETVDVRNLWRSLKPYAIKRNIQTLAKLSRSVSQAKEILKRFRPDIAVGTGGYACYPVLRAAHSLGIPTMVHESNAIPGLTTKVLMPYLTCALVNFKETKALFGRAGRVEVVGTPVRPDMLCLGKNESREQLGIGRDEKVIVSVMGSLGAKGMNRILAGMMKIENGRFVHIHSAGRGALDEMLETLRTENVDQSKLDVREYIYDMPLVMAAADLIVCRGGASTLSEVCAMAKPAIVIPSPNVVADHQQKNARVLEKAGAAVVITEDRLTAEGLAETAIGLLADTEKLEAMSKSAAKIACIDSAERILDIMKELIANN